MQPRTAEELATEIENLKNLKTSVPRFNFFGDDNHKKIDAQIAVLSLQKKAKEYYVDEDGEDYTDGDNDVFFAAEQAEMWMKGEIKEAPSVQE